MICAPAPVRKTWTNKSPEFCNPSRCPASSRAGTHAPTRNQRRRRLPSLRHRQGRHYQPCTLHRRGFYSCSFTPSKGVQRVRGGTSRKNCDGSTGMALGARVGCTRAPTSYEKHVHRARSTRAAVLQPPLTRISFAAQASGASDDKYYYDTDDASNFYMELWGLRTSRMLTHTRARFRRAQTPAQASTQTRGWGDAYARALTCACARLCRRCSPARGNLP